MTDRDHEVDLLISRVADAEASDADWARIEKLAQDHPGLWRELSEAQHQSALLTEEMGRACAIADTIDVPLETHAVSVVARRSRFVSAWAGWAAAAALALAWVAGGPGTPHQNADGTQTAGLGSAADALARYLDLGRKEGNVIQEVPEKVVLQAHEQDGVYDIYFVRQIIEHKRITNPEAFRTSTDEAGRAVLIPVDRVPAATSGSL